MLDKLYRIHDELKEKMPKPSELIVVDGSHIPFPEDGTFWKVVGEEKDSFIMDYTHWLQLKAQLYQNDLIPDNWADYMPVLNGIPVIFNNEYAMKIIRENFRLPPTIPPLSGDNDRAYTPK
jgi:hypothetical protein